MNYYSKYQYVLQQNKNNGETMVEWWYDGAKGVSPKLEPRGVHLEAHKDIFS